MLHNLLIFCCSVSSFQCSHRKAFAERKKEGKKHNFKKHNFIMKTATHGLTRVEQIYGKAFVLLGPLVIHFPSLTPLFSVFARALHCPGHRSCLSSCVFYNVSKASSFPISWFSHVLGHCHGWFLHVLGHCPGQLSCVLCHRAGRAKPTIKDRPKDQSDQSVYRTDQLEI